jgi:hypothetical protein
MYKFLLQERMQLDEVTQDELAKIEHIAAGEQFPNIFGGDQRIVIEHSEKTINSDITTGFQDIDKIMVPVAANAIQSFLNHISYSGARYEIDYGNALFVKKIMRQIPAGPKAGEYEEKTTKYKLSVLQDAIQAWTERNNSTEFNEKMMKLFAESKPRPDSLTHLITLLQNEIKTAFERQVKDARRFSDKDIKEYDIWSTVPKFFDFFYTNSGDNVIVISRAPVDLLRMSDFPGKGGPKTGIVSCHSPPRGAGGKYFACAIHEAKHNGAVAYLVPRRAVEQHKDKLQSREFFKDLEREGTQGAYPIQRLRLRRYIYAPTAEEILVPEITIYGQHMSEAFSRDLSKWARSVQSDKIAHILRKEEQEPKIHVAKFVLVGGSYSDTESEILLDYFLGQEVSTSISPTHTDDRGGKQIDQKWISEANDELFAEMVARFGGINTYAVSNMIKNKKISVVTRRTGDTIVRNITLNNATFQIIPFSTQKLLTLAKSKNEIQFENYLKGLITEFVFKPSKVPIKNVYANYDPPTKKITYGAEITITVPTNGVFSKELLYQIMSVGNAIKMCFSASYVGNVIKHVEDAITKDAGQQTVSETKKVTRFVMRERKNV